MFRKIAFLTGLMALAAAVPLHAALSDDRMRPDIVGWGADRDTVPIAGIDADGDILPARNLTQDVGESTRAWRRIFAGTVDASSGLVNVHETFVDLSSGSINGLAATRGISISTGDLIGGGSMFMMSGSTQPPGAPRNVTIFIASSPISLRAGVNLTTVTLIGSATFYGLDSKGNPIQEVISFSTASGVFNGGRSTDVGAGLCQTLNCDANPGLGIGNVAWAYISSFTINITSMTDAYGLMVTSPTFVISYGQKIGLANNIISTTSAGNTYGNFGDVIKIVEENGLDTTDRTDPDNVAVDVNPEFDYVVFRTLPDNLREKHIWYRFKRMFP